LKSSATLLNNTEQSNAWPRKKILGLGLAKFLEIRTVRSKPYFSRSGPASLRNSWNFSFCFWISISGLSAMRTSPLSESQEIHELFTLMQAVYASERIIIRQQPDTPFEKSYAYRYVKSLNDRLKSWEFNKAQTEYFIKFVIRYVKNKKIGIKGFSVFHQKNLLESCLKQVLTDLESFKRFRKNYALLMKWLREQARDTDLKTILLKRVNGLSNLLLWYKSSRITDDMLAVSKELMESLDGLPPAERQLLPSNVQLFLLRGRLKELSNV